MHGRSRMNMDPRILTMLGRSTSGFHRDKGGRAGGGGTGGGGWARCKGGELVTYQV